jgi:hypothetical protein
MELEGSSPCSQNYVLHSDSVRAPVVLLEKNDFTSDASTRMKRLWFSSCSKFLMRIINLDVHVFMLVCKRR